MRSFPFDSDVTYDADGNPEYDRGADSTILSDFIHLMFTDGVFPNPSTGLQVTASSEEMSVVVKPGNCMIQGRMGIEESDRTLVFNAAGTSYDRIDSVVARLNTNHDYRDIDLYVVKGTEASTPTAPELTRTGGIYELRLANVFISKNTTLISAERITDTRLADECGIVTSNPNPVDTATIFNQYQAALDAYLQFVEECIDGTTAGNLQTQIDALNETLANINTNLGNVSSALTTHKTSSDHDTRYYTKTQTDDFFKSSFSTVTSKVGVAYTKRAGWVFAFCTGAPSSAIPANVWTVIATMPSGYRPADNIPFVGNFGSVFFIGYVYTNGNIVIYPTQELPTGSNAICFNISYPVV
ncbi:MAG: hypothetical protein ACI4ES_12080 [Roseburia sp.]